jgi:hypothetical protein
VNGKEKGEGRGSGIGKEKGEREGGDRSGSTRTDAADTKKPHIKRAAGWPGLAVITYDASLQSLAAAS